MTWPTTFGSLLGGNQPASLFDGMFNQTAAMIQIPCSASGNNAVSLTPLVNCPALTAYNELGGYRFRANGSSSAAVTAQFNGLGFLPVYHADGATQANIGDLVNGQEYVLIYSATLSGGFPGFFLEQPAVGGSSGGGIGGVPGGRLTLQSGVPVMTSTQVTPQTVYYAPYINQFVPIWNGSTLTAYNFCSSLSDQVGLSYPMAGSASWPGPVNYDVYAILVGGVPVLAAQTWTNQTTRAIQLSIFAGMLTNATTTSMRTNSTTTVSVPANQGTLLGTFATISNGQSAWTFGGASSGGTAASFGICNYYNKVLFTTIVEDTGASYTYTSNTIRQARASTGNQISYVQSDSERSNSFDYYSNNTFTANVGAFLITGIGVNSTTAFNNFSLSQNVAAATAQFTQGTHFAFSSSGFSTVSSLEAGDNTHANTFDTSSNSLFFGSIWL